MSALRHFAHRVWSRRVLTSLSRVDTCRLFGLDLVITPGVLHPRHFASSRLLGEYLLTIGLDGLTLADIGTGSGFLALLAARAGAQVAAIDINPLAVECARENAKRNGLSDRVTVSNGSVFEGMAAGTGYDIVVTNPPFYPRIPEDLADYAFAAGPGHAFFSDLAAGLPARLTTHGRLILIHSSDTDFGPVSMILEARGFEGRIVRKGRGLFETLTIREFRRV